MDQWVRSINERYKLNLSEEEIERLAREAVVTAQRVRRLICDEFEAAFTKIDVIVAPTVGIAAETVEECNAGFVTMDGEKVPLAQDRGTLSTLCTIPFNVTGLPALSLCCGFAAQDLPLGMQVVTPPFEEGQVFQVAHVYEQAAGWYLRKPPVI